MTRYKDYITHVTASNKKKQKHKKLESSHFENL